MNADKVHKMFLDCLFQEAELVSSPTNPPEHVAVEGITRKIGFHPGRLASYKEKLQGMIDELHPNYTVGGGWTFLNLCQDKNGEQWTSFHSVMDEFCCLCIGNGLCKFVLPREMWSSLPGGMPYVVFNKEGV